MKHKSQQQQAQSLAAKQTKRTFKQWMTIAIFAFMVLIFAFLGITPGRLGGGGSIDGGVVATVNDTPISIARYQTELQKMEVRMRQQLAQFPEAMRKQFEESPQFGRKAMAQQAIKSLVDEEALYQAAQKRGIVVSDAEIRDQIVQIFKENDRFSREHYERYLSNTGMTGEDLDRELRKEMTLRKLQELFAASTSMARAETDRTADLKKQKVALHFVELRPADFAKPGFVSDDEVNKFLAANKSEVEAYYKTNQVEFMKPESVQARHLLIRVDSKRTEGEAQKLIADLRKQATPKNFAELATKNSEDPGSKAKGGELGEFSHGRMAPEFDAAAFATDAGKISAPVKTQFGYHLIYVEKKTPSTTTPMAQAQMDIARKLFARNKANDVVAKLKDMLKKGDKGEVDAFLRKTGLKWADTGEFDLSVAEVPKIHESHEILSEVIKHGKTPGLIGQLIDAGGAYYIVDVASWKEAAAPAVAKADGSGEDRAFDYQMFNALWNSWATDVVARASVQYSPRITEME